jgi:hypothetical protein
MWVKNYHSAYVTTDLDHLASNDYHSTYITADLDHLDSNSLIGRPVAERFWTIIDTDFHQFGVKFVFA